MRQLRQYFNGKFHSVFELKSALLSDIGGWVDELNAIVASRSSKGIKYQRCEFLLTSEERPELDLPEYRKDNDLDAEENVEIKGIREVEETTGNKGKAFLDFQRRPTNVLSRDVFNSVISLEDKIGNAIASFDAKVERLYKLKLRVGKCILAEELKILLHDKKLSELDKSERQEENLVLEFGTAIDHKSLSEQQLSEGRRALTEMKDRLLQLNEIDKACEKNLKREFPRCNYNQLEALSKVFRRRPVATSSATAGAANFERTVDIFARREERLRKAFGRTSKPGAARELKAKNIAALLERMSRVFLGTSAAEPLADGQTSKSDKSANRVVLALTLEELDRPIHCPDGIDGESWKTLCRLRREKIASEEKIAVLIAELAETEDSVNERERAAQRAIAAVTDLSTRLATFRRESNRRINDVDLVLTLKRGQIEVETQDLVPELGGAVLLKEGLISNLNGDIGRLGESKLNAMTESKDFRAGTRSLRWEKERLAMEIEDLKAKWTEIQQTKLSKESRQVLRSAASAAGDRSNSVTGSYLQLDNSSKSANHYLNQRTYELDAKLAELVDKRQIKDSENLGLLEEVEQLEEEVKVQKKYVEEKEAKLAELEKGDRVTTVVMRRALLIRKIKEQHEMLLSLQDQVDTFMYRSFPSLG